MNKRVSLVIALFGHKFVNSKSKQYISLKSISKSNGKVSSILETKINAFAVLEPISIVFN